MKVFIPTGVYPPESGGPATYVRLLEEYLPTQGIEVTVLPFARVRHLPKVLRHLVYLFLCIAHTRAADIVYAQDTVSVGLPSLLVARVFNKPFVVRVPGDHAWEQARQRFGVTDTIEDFQQKKYSRMVEVLRSFEHYVVSHARAVVTPSEFMRRIVSRWVSDPHKVQTIYSSIELPIVVSVPKDRREGFLLVTVGRLVPWKHVDGIIEVLERIPEASLVIVDDGPQRMLLEEQVARLGLGDRVRFVGRLPRTEALGWVSVADVFVLNSSYEGLSYLLVEAMALGVPVVATSVGGNTELIRAGVDGVLVPANDTPALAEAILTVKASPEVRARYVASAQARVEQNFSITIAVKKLVELCNTL